LAVHLYFIQSETLGNRYSSQSSNRVLPLGVKVPLKHPDTDRIIPNPCNFYLWEFSISIRHESRKALWIRKIQSLRTNTLFNLFKTLVRE